MRKLLTVPTLLCMPLLLAACSTLPPTQLASKTLSAMPRVQNSSKAPCGLQRQIAAQNTYLGSIAGTLPAGVVWTAPCDLAQPSKSAPVS